jgi:hypothetical protein
MDCPWTPVRDLLSDSKGWNRNCWCATSAIGQKGIAVTFIVHASRGEEATTTIRLSVVVAIAKGRALAEEGWQVFITAPNGIRYYPSEFDNLLLLSPVLHSQK